MREINNILICGLGAIGSIYANAINKYKPESLKILVDENRLKRYIENPLTFNGKQLRLNYILPDNKNFKADLIIIATKFDGLATAIENIKNFVYKNTIIISLLNGIDSEKLIAEKYGKDKVLYSYFIGHSAFRSSRNVTQDGIGKIVFGSPNNKIITDIVKNYFDKIDVNYEIPEDIIYSMWLKFALNVASNQTSAIMHMTFGEMVSNDKCMKFLKNIIKEVQSIAKAENIPNNENLLNDTIPALKNMSPDGKTSMLQDIEAKRKTEVEIFAGTIIRLGKKHNIPTPYNNCLYEMIKILENS